MIEFIEVNKSNWQECIQLPTSEAHRWVASNLYSIAEAQFYPKARAYCIYTEGQMVGFTMYGLDEEDGTVLCIDRLMIAEPYRGQGLGTLVLEKIIQEAIALGLSRVALSTASANLVAKHVYEKAGFHATDIKDGDEDVYHYRID